jgi:hypothetical protein
MLLSGVARLTQHAGQSRLLLTLSHAAGDQIKAMIANIRKGLDHVLASAPQLPKASRWPALVRYIVSKISRRDRRKRGGSACRRLCSPMEAANRGI